MHTRLKQVVLRLVVEGPCTIRVLRRVRQTYHLIHENACAADLQGARELSFVVTDESTNFRHHGLVFFEVSANQGGPGRFIEASWHAAQPVSEIRLAAVLCTFNREAYVAKVLDVVASDPIVSGSVERLLVINQGRPDLARHPALAAAVSRLGSRLQVVEQGNFGGAGGFTRGLIEAMRDPSITHVALLDDDIILEPDTLVRMAAFLALANDNVAFGGHMLDSVQPTHLYEAGGIFDEQRWFMRPVHYDVDIANVDVLADVAVIPAMHYNAWWCFALPTAMLRRAGLPLPCFIRGDDAEFGTRLYKQGISTISLPGAAVWHEPFYLKLGSWHLYYETRNLLVLGSLHHGYSAAGLVRNQLRHLLIHLLTYRYYSSALILRGIEDFLAGPEIMRLDPRPLHARLGALRTQFPTPTLSRARVLGDATPPRLPHGRPAYLFWLLFVLIRSAIKPVHPARLLRLPVRDFGWITLRRIDSIVLDTWWEEEMPIYTRSRSSFRQLFRQAVSVFVRLYRHGPAAARQWREAAPDLTSPAFWHDYLARPAPPPD